MGKGNRVTRSSTSAASTATNNSDTINESSNKTQVRRSSRLLRSEPADPVTNGPNKRQRMKQEHNESDDNQPNKKVKKEFTTGKQELPILVVNEEVSVPVKTEEKEQERAAAVVKTQSETTKKVNGKGKGRMTRTNTNGASSASTPSLLYSNSSTDNSSTTTPSSSSTGLSSDSTPDLEEQEERPVILSSDSDTDDGIVNLSSSSDDENQDSSDNDDDGDGLGDIMGAFHIPHIGRNRTVVVRRRGPIMTHAQRTNMKLLHHHPELKTVWDELDNTTSVEPEPIEQPAELKLPLLSFQLTGVGWMCKQEKLNDFKGGVLADEMGMGKTIQTIALLLSDKKKPNLVVAPVVAIMQWKHEIEEHTNNALEVEIFHGANRRKYTAAYLKKMDVVLTTYGLIEAEFRKQEMGRVVSGELVKEKSILHKIKWHRIILDEAHNIKDRSSNTARACFNLEANYRWSLTGTPLQNRVGELYSLIRFMQADPFAYYYCKSCDCKKINWEFSDKKGCDSCGHTPMDHVCWWNNEVLKPIQTHGNIGEGRLAMGKLRKLLDKMMLRRTKIECADDLGLPPRVVTVRRDMFNEEEEDVYRSLYSDTARQFTTYVEEGSILNNYANIFELLTRMRLCANHPDLVTKKKDMTGNKQLVCMLCSEPPEDAIRAACRHVFCRECCTQYLQSFDSMATNQQPRCPSCFANFSVDLSQPPLELEEGPGDHSAYSKTSIVNRIDMAKWRSSTKIEALVEELSLLRREDRTIKSIVFSQFVNFLDLIYWRLSRAGFECIRLDGTMSPQQRDAAIQHFMTKPSCTVFLISLKAGGVALNLTEASRVFICDPWWNPAAELQAMDRIHRLGQRRPIQITRLVIENSIESRIVQLQEKKTALVDSTLGKDTSALEQLSVEDLRFLFVL